MNAIDRARKVFWEAYHKHQGMQAIKEIVINMEQEGWRDMTAKHEALTALLDKGEVEGKP